MDEWKERNFVEPYYLVRRTGSPAFGDRGQEREAPARRTEGQSGVHDRVQ